LRVRDEYQGKDVWCPSCKAALTLAGERVPNHEVFVSYSNKDKAVADTICATLEEKKIRCWIAPRDISAGNSWGGSIIEAIEDAQVMVLVYSGHSNLSPQIIREIERAVAKGLLIVPFRIEAAPMSKDMEYFLSSSHWFDALTPPLEQHLAQFAEMVRLILFKKAQAKDTVTSTDPVAAAMPRAKAMPWKGAATAMTGVALAVGVFLGVRQYQLQKDAVTSSSANLPGTQTASRTPAGTQSSLGALIDAGAAAAAKAPQVQTVQSLTTSIGMELLYIPPGEFMMGSTPEEREWAAANGCGNKWSKYEGEKPRKTKIRQGLWLGKIEVTVGQWRQFAHATKYQTEAEQKGYGLRFMSARDEATVKGASWHDPKFGFAITDNHPACFISWNDAVAFCAWLTEQERKNGRLPSGFVVRLPTEAEWEYACRAGSQTYFWWGDTKEGGEGRLNRNGKADGFEFVAPINYYGDRGENRFGLADMLGNVAEWCLDGFDPTRAHEDCFTENTAKKVIRGGAHDDSIGLCRCAFRFGFPPNFQNYGSGFRVCYGAYIAGATTPQPAAQPGQ
jgi:formylglycine-generating enzyme required for sulfatase activity